MKEFRPYLKLLRDLTYAKKKDDSTTKSKVEVALNGQPSEYLREHINIEVLRGSGIFFTGHKFANKLVKPFAKAISEGVSVFDPACGAGDLLLASAKRMPLAESLSKTLDLWGTVLHGCDVDPEFMWMSQI